MNLCKSCGGNRLVFNEKDNTYTCQYCDTVFQKQEAPVEKIEREKDRASKLFVTCNFDGASALYQSIVTEKPDDAESYWYLALCAYGVQYVDDPATGKKIPTCNRTLYEPIFNNQDYISALDCADFLTKTFYESEAQKIDQIQRGIIEIANKEEPYDIFISYKETDSLGGKTKESDIAKDLYYKLDKAGYRTFYAPITLQDKAGHEYEPYIFKALNSAKIMFVIAFSKENADAPWVRNEWMRFIIRKGKNPKLFLVPCYNSFFMNANEFPVELSSTQARDMSNASTNDLVVLAQKLYPKKAPEININNASLSGSIGTQMNAEAAALCDRGYIFLQEGNNDQAQKYFNNCLDKSPKFSNAYWGLLLVENNCRDSSDLIKRREKTLENEKNYQYAIRFGSSEEVAKYEKINSQIAEKILKEAQTLCDLGYQNIAEKQFGDAQVSFESCIQKNPNLARAYWGLLLTHYHVCNNEELMSSVNEALENNPYYNNALAKASEEDKKEYLNNSSKILERLKKEAAELNEQGYSFLSREDYTSAESIFAQSIKKNPNVGSSYWGQLLATYKCKSNEAMIALAKPIQEKNNLYSNAIKYSDPVSQNEYVGIKEKIDSCIAAIINKITDKRENDIRNYINSKKESYREKIDELKEKYNDLCNKNQENNSNLTDELNKYNSACAPIVKALNDDMGVLNLYSNDMHTMRKKDVKKAIKAIRPTLDHIEEESKDISDIIQSSEKAVSPLEAKRSICTKEMSLVEKRAIAQIKEMESFGLTITKVMSFADSIIQNAKNGDYNNCDWYFNSSVDDIFRHFENV